jgi:hypothetical protein
MNYPELQLGADNLTKKQKEAFEYLKQERDLLTETVASLSSLKTEGIYEVFPFGNPGGDALTGANVRNLNTLTNTVDSFITLSVGGSFILDPGKYLIDGFTTMGNATGTSSVSLESSGTKVIQGASTTVSTLGSVQIPIKGIVESNKATTYTLVSYAKSAATNGLGGPGANPTGIEVYSYLMIRKLL